MGTCALWILRSAGQDPSGDSTHTDPGQGIFYSKTHGSGPSLFVSKLVQTFISEAVLFLPTLSAIAIQHCGCNMCIDVIFVTCKMDLPGRGTSGSTSCDLSCMLSKDA